MLPNPQLLSQPPSTHPASAHPNSQAARAHPHPQRTTTPSQLTFTACAHAPAPAPAFYRPCPRSLPPSALPTPIYAPNFEPLCVIPKPRAARANPRAAGSMPAQEVYLRVACSSPQDPKHVSHPAPAHPGRPPSLPAPSAHPTTAPSANSSPLPLMLNPRAPPHAGPTPVHSHLCTRNTLKPAGPTGC